MKRVLSLVLTSVLSVLLSCIRNDVPYPDVEARIVDLQVEGADKIEIDAASRVVTVRLNEAVDPRNANILSVTYNDARVSASEEIEGVHDLSSPFSVTLSVYYEFVWTIRAVQEVERIFTVSGGAGASIIDEKGFTATAFVPKGTDFSAVRVTSLKLGPEGATSYSPELSRLVDFSEPKRVRVEYRDVVEEWTLCVSEVEQEVSFTFMDAWTAVAWLGATRFGEGDCGFRIRKAGETDWREVQGVSVSGSSFTAAADGLEPLTEYECIAYCAEETSRVQRFKTEAALQLPNAGFETVSHAESSKYYSFYDPSSSDESLQNKWWGCGNKGSTTIGASYAITMPDDTDKVEGERSLKMTSRYVVIKFAAGNVFSGYYDRTIGISGGAVHMGRPFTVRPRKLTLYLKYISGKIEKKTIGDVPEGEEVNVGDNDRASVWIALGDWDYRRYGGSAESPVEINTTDKSTFFDPEGENVIAYGRYVATESINEWTKVEIPLKYTSTSRVPTHIIVSCASSMLGDYFTGSQNSILWVDDLRLEY